MPSKDKREEMKALASIEPGENYFSEVSKYYIKSGKPMKAAYFAKLDREQKERVRLLKAEKKAEVVDRVRRIVNVVDSIVNLQGVSENFRVAMLKDLGLTNIKTKEIFGEKPGEVFMANLPN